MILSLFPGIGLLDQAFELEGFCVVRGPDVLWGGDIRRFHPPAGKFSGIIGGPPCQSFSSLAHLVRANGYEPKFGNLVPEFERCVLEAQPVWFMMENVPAAPESVVAGYGIKSFLLDNSALAGEDGMGQEQRRVRRFTFGMRGVVRPPNLCRWIDLATFLLPDAEVALTQRPVDNSKEAKGGRRNPPVTAMQGGESQRPTSDRVYARRYKLADACRLQGLPEDFLADAPFAAEGKLKAVANGVAMPTGRAIARAIKEATHAAE